jgi:hypothetical protein
MKAFYIFDIPVYLCAENAYYAEMEAVEVAREKAPPWYFNQVVGWIRLFAEGSSVGGHLWWVDARSVAKTNAEDLFYPTNHSYILAAHEAPREKTLQWGFNQDTTREDNSKIFGEVLAQIERIAKEPPLEGRYVDLRTFRNAGPFINWRELLEWGAKGYIGFTMDNTSDFAQETLDAMNQELARRLGLSGPHELESLIYAKQYDPIIQSILTLFYPWRVEDGDDEDTQPS